MMKKIRRKKKAAILTAPRASVTPEKVLVPIDFSLESTRALQYASEVAGKHGAEVTLLHVVEPIHYVHDFGYGPVRRQRTDHGAVKSAGVRLRSLGRRHLAIVPSWKAVVRSGTTCEEIAKTARERAIDLLVMPTRGLRPEHARSTSIAAKVVRQAPCPVLTLRRPLLVGRASRKKSYEKTR